LRAPADEIVEEMCTSFELPENINDALPRNPFMHGTLQPALHFLLKIIKIKCVIGEKVAHAA
jgi:hypothetical protein